MNHNTANLQVHIHKLDGSSTTFLQNDAGEIKKLLDEFQPAQIFDRDKITFTDKNFITSLPISKITRIDLESEEHCHLLFPVGVVDAVELTGAEFQTLIRNPVMREQWKQISTLDASLVTFLDVEMADGQCVFLTMEMPIEQHSGLWKMKGYPFNGSGLCFRMRNGGIAVMNLDHLTRLTFFPKPLHKLADSWHAHQFHSQSPTKHINGSHSEATIFGNLPPTSQLPQDESMNFRRK